MVGFRTAHFSSNEYGVRKYNVHIYEYAQVCCNLRAHTPILTNPLRNAFVSAHPWILLRFFICRTFSIYNIRIYVRHYLNVDYWPIYLCMCFHYALRCVCVFEQLRLLRDCALLFAYAVSTKIPGVGSLIYTASKVKHHQYFC